MKKRISALTALTDKKNAFYVSDPSDIFYLSGFSGTFGRIVCINGIAVFITDPRYGAAVKKSPIARDFEIHITKNFRSDLITLIDSKNVMLGKNTPLSEYLIIKEACPCVIMDETVASMRMIKDSSEIELIKKSINICEKAFKHIRTFLRPGVSEMDISVEFEYFSKKAGADGVSFTPIIAFNENGAVPHHATSLRKLKVNTLVLVDSGVSYKGYASDLTRVFAFGIIQPRLRAIQKHYELVQKAKETGVACYKPGAPIKEAELAVRKYLAGCGLESFFTHSLGHSFGLNIHEPPSVNSKEERCFEKGMVFTCEPGIYLDNKYGIRIEDDYLITADGADKLGEYKDSLIICD
jgi:Xaa-Pro aminopeptidase